MSDLAPEDRAADMVNHLTAKISEVLQVEFNKLPADMQLNIVMIKTVQLLMANVLCHVAADKEELDQLLSIQGEEIAELTRMCANMAFTEKFGLNKH
jgi:hypothetical protein